MKFGYNYEQLSELINNYSKVEDKIIIRFLDGSEEEIPLTKENEKNLIQRMLVQAQNRSDSDIRESLNKQKKSVIGLSAAMLSMSIMNFANELRDINDFFRLIFGLIGANTIIFFIISGKLYVIFNDKLQELDKYDIYLSMYEELEEYKDKFDVYDGVNNYEELNINTIDNFTLDAVKRIKYNLNKFKNDNKELQFQKVTKKLKI